MVVFDRQALIMVDWAQGQWAGCMGSHGREDMGVGSETTKLIIA